MMMIYHDILPNFNYQTDCGIWSFISCTKTQRLWCATHQFILLKRRHGNMANQAKVRVGNTWSSTCCVMKSFISVSHLQKSIEQF